MYNFGSGTIGGEVFLTSTENLTGDLMSFSPQYPNLNCLYLTISEQKWLFGMVKGGKFLMYFIIEANKVMV